MPSMIEVKEKTVNKREVVSFSKHYAEEEHEVFAPKEHATQILLNLLAVVNNGKDTDDRLLLVRQGEYGRGDAGDVTATTGDLYSREAVVAVARELLGEDVAENVADALDAVE